MDRHLTRSAPHWVSHLCASPAAQLCCGCIDASRPVLTRAIKRGENVILLPGGEKEMMLTDGSSTVTQPVPAGRPHSLLAC